MIKYLIVSHCICLHRKLLKNLFSVLASYDFKATRANELSFERGALLANVEKLEGGQWYGEYKGSRGWFPANHVKKIQIT